MSNALHASSPGDRIAEADAVPLGVVAEVIRGIGTNVTDVGVTEADADEYAPMPTPLLAATRNT